MSETWSDRQVTLTERQLHFLIDAAGRRIGELERRLERTSYDGKPRMKDAVLDEKRELVEVRKTLRAAYKTIGEELAAEIKKAEPIVFGPTDEPHRKPTDGRFSFTYSTVDGGGEKWQLVETRSYGDMTLATLIRLPGSMTRIFASQALSDHYNVPSKSDHSGPCEARLALADWLDFQLPKLPNRSDEAHARAVDWRRRRIGRSGS